MPSSTPAKKTPAKKTAAKEPEKAKRITRTPRERAQDALDTQGRVVAGMKEKATKLAAELDDVRGKLAAAEKRLAYYAQSPDLESDDTIPGADA